jgi:hypothetical protein
MLFGDQLGAQRNVLLLQDATAAGARETQLHVLTEHERMEFRDMQEKERMRKLTAQVAMLKGIPSIKNTHRAAPSKQRVSASLGAGSQKTGSQQLAHWPYRHSSAVLEPGEHLDTLGRAIHNSEPEERRLIQHYILQEFQPKPGSSLAGSYSQANPPCYTPEDCSRFVSYQPGAHTKKQSGLPVYDNDMLELIAAMQKQDKMFLQVKTEKEKRAKEVAKAKKQGKPPPPLPKVTCGRKCWEDKGVWCCRLK